MRAPRILIAVLAVGALVAACGDDESTDTPPTMQPDSTSVDTPAPTDPPTTTVAPTTVAPTTVAPTTSPPTTVPVQQLAIWPATDVVFATPEEAALDFIAEVFGFPGVIGPFMAGDSRSGEIEVFASEDGSTPIGSARSTLFLRQLPPADGWFVLGAASGGVTIDTPAPGASVTAGPLEVSGLGTGFEALVVVEAFVVGRPDPLLDLQTDMAGNFGELGPYSVILDIGDAAPGDVVVVLVHGGVGLETDPGDFAALPVMISG